MLITSSLIASYPPLYLFGTASSILTGSVSNSEIDSLRSFDKLLRAVVGSIQDSSYFKRLEEVSSILIDAATASDAAANRRRTPSSAYSLSRPSSSYFAPQKNASGQMVTSNDDQSFGFTGSMGLDQQYFEFPDLGGLRDDYSDQLPGYLAFMN